MTENASPGSMPNESAANEKQSQPVRRRGLWLWFAVGFLIVFVGMLLFVPMVSMHPSGEFVVACQLWQYYILAIQRGLHSSGNLGPTTGSSAAAVNTLLQHVLFSVVGGAFMLAIVWSVRKFKGLN